MTTALQVEGLAIKRAGRVLLESIDLSLETGAILALTGPSGSGKTTLLRAILGLDTPTRGQILMAGRTVSAPERIVVAPEKRRIAMVFQDLGLWPHMDIAEHLRFALAARDFPKSNRAARINGMLESVGLQGREQHRPGTLSGGERQRLAIARALVTDPSVVLLDEPLSNLDVVLKCELISLLATLLKAQGSTAIFVTHDPRETLSLTTDLAVLERGRIVQRGNIAELTHSPATPFVRQVVALCAQAAT